MTLRSLAGTTALVLSLTSTGLLADVTPEDVWQAWQNASTAVGTTVTSESAVRDGDALVVSNVALADSAGSAITLETVTFTDNGDGTLEAVDFLEQPAPVARDIFRHGAISLATTERVVSIILEFQKSLDELGLNSHEITRAAVTNILSEAKNQETFMNRIRIGCGLRLGAIDDGEMTRLIYLKTRRRLSHLPGMKKGATLVLHVVDASKRSALMFIPADFSRPRCFRSRAKMATRTCSPCCRVR